MTINFFIHKYFVSKISVLSETRSFPPLGSLSANHWLLSEVIICRFTALLHWSGYTYICQQLQTVSTAICRLWKLSAGSSLIRQDQETWVRQKPVSGSIILSVSMPVWTQPWNHPSARLWPWITYNLKSIGFLPSILLDTMTICMGVK